MGLENVRVEVRPNPDLFGDAGSGDNLTEKLTRRVDEVGESILAIADRFAAKLDEGPPATRPASDWHVDEVEIGLALDLEAEAGVVIARVGTKAGFHVTIKWARGA